jgi:DNA-binding LacI/PurR family transcriptional regulator
MVCVLAPFPRSKAGMDEDPLNLKLRSELMKLGIGWEEIFDARLGRSGADGHLQKLVGTRRRVCWMMDAASPGLQRWFHRARLPALVLGSCHPGVLLPSVDSNYHSAGWHAAGCMARLGHKRILAVWPDLAGPGDRACRDGIADYIARTKADIVLEEIEAGPSHDAFKAKLQRLLARRPRPTAIITMRAKVALAVFYQLQLAGLRVPNDVSLVSRDTDEILEAGMPELTRYHSSLDKKVKASVRIIQSLLNGQVFPPAPNLVTPTYIPGETLCCPLETRKAPPGGAADLA